MQAASTSDPEGARTRRSGSKKKETKNKRKKLMRDKREQGNRKTNHHANHSPGPDVPPAPHPHHRSLRVILRARSASLPLLLEDEGGAGRNGVCGEAPGVLGQEQPEEEEADSALARALRIRHIVLIEGFWRRRNGHEPLNEEKGKKK